MTKCKKCGGLGWIKETVQGKEVAVRCSCKSEMVSQQNLELPPRAQHWFIKNFSSFENDSLKSAKITAREYAAAFPAVDYGLMFVGPTGTGKSHLAVAVLKEVCELKRGNGVFIDFSDLLYQLQRSIGFDGTKNVEAILRPLVDADLLLLDDFASSQGNYWTLDMVYHLLNQRYLKKKHVLITTRYAVLPPGAKGGDIHSEHNSLSARVGVSLASRLLEMCRVVVLEGKDHRRESIQPGYRFS